MGIFHTADGIELLGFVGGNGFQRYSVNSGLTNQILHRRGGDCGKETPSSLFFFVLVVDCLGRLMDVALNQTNVLLAPLGRQIVKHRASHGSIIFTQPLLCEISAVSQIL